MLNIPWLAKYSKKCIASVLAAVLLLDILLLSYFQVLGPLVDVHQTVSSLIQPTDFHRQALELFDQVETDKVRFWSAHSEMQHLEASIPVNMVLAEPGSAGPDEIFYDPRFTISVYMDELRRLGESTELPELPFHWVDWVDVTLKNTQIGLDQSKKTSCTRLKNRIRGRPDPLRFCVDNHEVSDEDMEAFGFRNRNQLPQAIITEHCSHDNPSFNGVRVFMAKSYTMTHLPKPLKVLILNDKNEGGTYEFMVNQTAGSDQRLLFSGLVDRFIEQNAQITSAELLQRGGNFQINPSRIYENLVKAVPPRHLPEDQDVMAMHKIVKSAPGSDKDIRLLEKHFDYPKDLIQKQIEEYEAIKERDVMQQNYFEGLQDCAKYDGTNEPTYFKMATLDIRERKNTINDWGWHYDWRFFSDALFYEKVGWTKAERVERTNIILERLLRNWNRFAEEKGIVTWIMHGPLLSWYWDGLMFPYDVDIDIQMPISEMIRLTKEYNQTLVIEPPSEGYGRFLIDVGTYIHNRERSDTGNHIDARFVDVDSGIYIDITALAKSSFNLPNEYKENPIVSKNENDANAEVYNDRRKHFYTLPQLEPLHYSMMGGVPLYVPHQIEDRLRWEYRKGLDDYEFKDWYFVPKLQLWLMKDQLVKYFKESDYKNDKNEFDKGKMINRVKEMSDAEGLKLLKEDDILAEYYFTSKLTDWHLHEKLILFTKDGKDNLTALDDPVTRRNYNDLVGQIAFDKPLRKCLFEYETFDREEHHVVEQ